MLNIELRPLDWFQGNRRNPRQHGRRQVKELAASLRRHGAVVPAVAQPDGSLIAGHGRLLAAREAGFQSYPVLIVDCDEREALRLMAALNYIYHWGDNDTAALARVTELLDSWEGSGIVGPQQTLEPRPSRLWLSCGEVACSVPAQVYDLLLTYLHEAEERGQTMMDAFNEVIEHGLQALGS